VRHLLSCKDASTGATAELSVGLDGSLVLLRVFPTDTFFTIEYRGSDVSAVRNLNAGGSASLPAQLLNEFARRDNINVDVRSGATTLTLESAEHGSRTFDCHGGGTSPTESAGAQVESAPAPDDSTPLTPLLKCHDTATHTSADLAIPTGSDGSLISLRVAVADDFYTIEYRGSDVGAVRDLRAHRSLSVPAQLLTEFARRDSIHVDFLATPPTLDLESAQHGSRSLTCDLAL
jgi:hypothetical protein